MEENFYINKKIYYHDTDCGGVVYYANYLKHMEESRTEFCIHKGVDIKKLSEAKIFFVIAHIELNYKSPARYLDTISIFTRLENIGTSSVSFSQEIKRDDKLLVEAKVTWVCVGENFKPRKLPDIIEYLRG